MNSPFLQRLREAAAACLPEGAFLRLDRGEGLFVTDAPRRAPGGDWQARLLGVGFDLRVDRGLAHLTPGPVWLDALASARPDPPDWLCASLKRFDRLPPDAESMTLFAVGLKALAGAPDGGDYDRLLRRRAAVCLRGDPPAGGGLYACALVQHLIERKRAQ